MRKYYVVYQIITEVTTQMGLKDMITELEVPPTSEAGIIALKEKLCAKYNADGGPDGPWKSDDRRSASEALVLNLIPLSD